MVSRPEASMPMPALHVITAFQGENCYTFAIRRSECTLRAVFGR
jgi:hypothetical protein